MASSMGWTGILAASTLAASTTMDSLADGANASGAVITASQYMYSDWWLHTEPGSAPSGHVELYFVTNFGGSAADGNGSIDPPATAMVGTFPLREVVGAQNVALNFILTPNRDFKPVIINECGVTLGGSLNSLYFEMYGMNPDM